MAGQSPDNPGLASTTDRERFFYDTASNLTQRRTRADALIAYEYDNLNRLVRKVAPPRAGGAGEGEDTVAYVYDALGRRLSATFGAGGNVAASYDLGLTWTYDNADRLLSQTINGQPNGAGGRVARTVAYGYDNGAGDVVNRSRLVYPSATGVLDLELRYGYDALGRLASLSQVSGGVSTVLSTYGYDDLSRRTALTLGGVATRFDYRTDNSLLSRQTVDFAGTTGDVSRTYSYNRLGEITRFDLSNPAYQWEGYYPVSGRAYAANGLNQYRSAASRDFGYDTNGNLTQDVLVSGRGQAGETRTLQWTFRYTPENQLIQVQNPVAAIDVAYRYDTAGRLARKVVTGGETVYQVYDGVDLIAEYLEGGQLRRRIVHGPGVDEPIVEDSFAGATPTRRFLHADHQGSVVASSDAGGTAAQQLGYGLFGESEQEAGPTLRYTGQRYEPETGLYYYKARFYSPYLGRFLQADPIGYEDGLNLYAYVGNDPINGTDPSGEVTNLLTAGAGTIVGGIGGGIIQLGSNYLSGKPLTSGLRGAIAGGAAGGFVAGLTGCFTCAGGVAGATTNLVNKGIGNIGTKDFLVDTAVGVVTGGVLKFVPAIKLPGITSGRNSFLATTKALQTKLNNGTISSVSAKSFGKAVGADAVENAGRTAAEPLVQNGIQAGVGAFQNSTQVNTAPSKGK